MIIDFPNEVDIALNYTKAPGYSQAGEEEKEGRDMARPPHNATPDWLVFLTLSNAPVSENICDSWVPLAACGCAGGRVWHSLGLCTSPGLSLPLCKMRQC